MFAIDTLTALKPSLKHDLQYMVQLLQLEEKNRDA